jgi:hypothetical protein
MRWTRDRWLWAAILVGLALRVLPLVFWYDDSCVRDECTYIKLGKRMADGQGMTASAGWLWAPGWPTLVGVFSWLTGWGSVVVALSIPVSAANQVLLYQLAQRVFGGASEDRQLVAARVAAWMYGVSLHQAFFAQRMWSEVVYTCVLLGGLMLFVRARDAVDMDRRRDALVGAGLLGVAIGVCVLFRGVAQYMMPVFVVGLLWGRLRRAAAWAQVPAMVAGMALVVAPYSIHATEKFETFVLTDRTLGQMMWLGNNDYPPITFDYGNGQLSHRAFNRHKEGGRPVCAKRTKALELDACQTEGGKVWILAIKGEFLRRMPMRVAQLLNPHSLLTRHLRWNRYPGMGLITREVLILTQAVANLVVMFVGAFGLVTRGRRARGVVIAGILLYHVAAIAALAGLTRYRVPLEPLLMLYAAGVFADWPGTKAALSEGPLRWRLLLTVATLAVLTPLILWYLPAAWPEWRHW